MAAPTLDRAAETTPPPRTPDVPAEQPRVRLNPLRADGAWSVVGSLLGGIGLVWVLDQRVLPLSGALGFWILCYLAFLALYAVVAWTQWPPREVTNRVVSVLLSTAALAVVAAVLAQILFVAIKGFAATRHANFWTQTLARTGPLNGLESGGMIHALVGSLEQLGLATLFSVPLGLLAALYLVESDDWLVGPVRVIVQAMTALPEIIAGLFVYVLAILTLGVDKSGFAGSLALTVMMIPIVTRTAEVIMRLVPAPLREASYALGASHFRTVWNVVLPTARSGLSTAVILAMARAVGETAPVLFTVGFTNGMNTNPFSQPQADLPLYIFYLARAPQQAYVDRAIGAGLALLAMVLLLFLLARAVGGRPPGQLSKRQQRRLNRGRGAAADADELRRADETTVRGALPPGSAHGYPDVVL